MTQAVTTLLFWFLAALALAGALTVLLTRDLMRLVIGLGVTLIALAGLFGLFGFGFLAVAEIFLYVGGVLVVFLFAIMLVHRVKDGAPELETRHGIWPALVATAVFGVLVYALGPALGDGVPGPSAGGVEALAETLLKPMLPQFEIAGVLLLAALAAVVALMTGGRE